MNVDFKNFLNFSKPFVDASKNVFETMIFTKLVAGKVAIKEDNKSRGDVSAILGLTGEITQDDKKNDYQAILVFSWPYETYLKVSSAMLQEEFTEFDEENADVGREIVNMVMGNAKSVLTSMGYSSNMAIPSMIEGTGHSINYPSGTTVVEIPFESDHGPMTMELCYSEK